MVKRKREDANDENQPPSATPAGSRRKPTLRGRRGVLERLRDVPIELTCLIFGHLDPGSLLNVARCSTYLREMLMRKDIAWLWAKCRQNVEGLPDCPPHLSEPAYADLVFNKRCHGCSKAGVARVIWEASARYCDECARVQMVGVRHFFKDPANSIYSRFKKLVLTVTVDSRLSFHKPDLLRLYSSWVGLEEHGSWQDFVMEQNGHLEVFRAYVEACQEWKRSIDVVRTEELQSIRDQRVSFIKARLLELGYPKATVEAADAKLQTSKQVRVSKPLDNKGWSRMCAQLVSLMDDFEQSQVYENRIQELADILDEVRKDHLHDPDIRWWPGTADLLLMQGTSYRARLTSGPSPVNVSDYLELKAQIRRDISRWLDNKSEELEEAVREMKEDFFPIGIRAIDLVVCVFYCDSCHQRIRFPEILVHRCLRGLMDRRYRVLDQEIQQREDLFEKAVLETCGYCPWSLTGYVRYLKQKRHPQQTTLVSLVSDIDHGLINTIIMCGKDPFYTKWDEMDKRNPVFSLRNTNITVKVMGWRCATLSDALPIQVWRIDDPALRPKAVDMMKTKRRMRTQYVKNQQIWCCARCADQWMFLSTYAEIIQHVLAYHDKHATLKDGDIYCNPDDWHVWMGPLDLVLATPAATGASNV